MLLMAWLPISTMSSCSWNPSENGSPEVLASIDDGLLAIDKNGNIITSNSYIKTYFNVSNPKTIYDFQYQSFLRDIFDSLNSLKIIFLRKLTVTTGISC